MNYNPLPSPCAALNLRRWWDIWGLAVYGLLLWLVLMAGIFWLVQWQCLATWKSSQFDFRYSIGTGCQLHVGEQWLPVSSVRFNP